MTSLSTNSVCYEAIQRKYRNAMVRHLRQQLTSAFPNEWESKLKHPFAQEWDGIVKNAQALRDTGELATPVVDFFDYLSVNHFYNLFDLYFDVILIQRPGYRRPPKANILKYIKEVKDFRDPLSHPAEIDFSILDSVAMIDSGRRVVMLFDPVVAHEMEDLAKELLGRDLNLNLPREPLDDNLPPQESIVTRFTGRNEELNQLDIWFNNPEAKRWLLAGEGGTGKTAIAFQFGIKVKYMAPEPYQAVLWLSAKKRRFVSGQVTAIENPDFCDLDTAVNKLLVDIGWVEAITQDLKEKKKLLLKLLTEFPSLLIVDDLETLEGEDESTIEFFTLYVPQTASKVLFTSRRQPFGLGSTVTVIKGFGRDEGHKFIRSRVELLQLDQRAFSISDLDRILKATDGSPLYIEDLLRVCCTGMNVDNAIRYWKEGGGGDTAREFALKRELNYLTKPAQNILLACCIKQQASTHEELCVATGLSDKDVVKAMEELHRYYLIPKPSFIDAVLVFDVNSNIRMLVLDIMKESDTYRRIDFAIKALGGELELSTRLRAEIGAYVRYCAAQMRLGSFDKAESKLKDEALIKYPNHPDLLAQLGLVYAKWKTPSHLSEARQSFNKAAEFKCKKWFMYSEWWRMEIWERQWSLAAEAAMKGLKILPDDWQLKYLEGYARSRLGRELMAGFSTSKGKDELIKAQKLLEAAVIPVEKLVTGEFQVHSSLIRALVLNCEAIGDQTKLATYLLQWTNEHPDDSDQISERSRLITDCPAKR
jgi:hypothetical protein